MDNSIPKFSTEARDKSNEAFQKTNIFLNVPHELLEEIFSFLSTMYVPILSLVNEEFNLVLKKESFWNRKINQYNINKEQLNLCANRTIKHVQKYIKEFLKIKKAYQGNDAIMGMLKAFEEMRNTRQKIKSLLLSRRFNLNWINHFFPSIKCSYTVTYFEEPKNLICKCNVPLVNHVFNSTSMILKEYSLFHLLACDFKKRFILKNEQYTERLKELKIEFLIKNERFKEVCKKGNNNISSQDWRREMTTYSKCIEKFLYLFHQFRSILNFEKAKECADQLYQITREIMIREGAEAFEQGEFFFEFEGANVPIYLKIVKIFSRWEKDFSKVCHLLKGEDDGCHALYERFFDELISFANKKLGNISTKVLKKAKYLIRYCIREIFIMDFDDPLGDGFGAVIAPENVENDENIERSCKVFGDLFKAMKLAIRIGYNEKALETWEKIEGFRDFLRGYCKALAEDLNNQILKEIEKSKRNNEYVSLRYLKKLQDKIATL